jgi:meso-butanediol dehydrogenase / (S,S)-butanediol dehydrogenase / diacetyl reductase
MRKATKFAIVTGAASGIGFATAERLATLGYDIGLVDIDAENIDRVQRAVKSAGREAIATVLDVGLCRDFGPVVETYLERWPVINALVNNAGIGVAATLPETTLEDWDQTIAVNLSAMFHTCRAVLPHMARAGQGSIVNVSSVAGLVGVKKRAAYCASKAGVIGLTRAIAVDFAHLGIRANAICPGTVDTEWIDRILGDADDPLETRHAMEMRQLDGRMGTPEEVANGIAFLVVDESRFVNGSAFVMDGGMTAV